MKGTEMDYNTQFEKCSNERDRYFNLVFDVETI